LVGGGCCSRGWRRRQQRGLMGVQLRGAGGLGARARRVLGAEVRVQVLVEGPIVAHDVVAFMALMDLLPFPAHGTMVPFSS
jgi:hypothetical protein